MRIHADLTRRAAVRSNGLAWIASPLAGVERRMLDRDGEEVARATSIVRYAPGSCFSPHAHGGGEEFLVLEGVFSDEHGDYPAGFYVRNPVGSAHKPHSEEGCVILVKLHQMDPEDQTYVRLDTRAAPWVKGALSGVTVQPLHLYRSERVGLVKLAPAARLARHTHPGGVEIFVVEGTLTAAGETWDEESWLRFPPGDVHDLSSDRGCRLFVKVGHLAMADTAAPMILETVDEKSKPATAVDDVIEADRESFPASDPPAWIGSHAGAPVRGDQ